MKHHRAFHHVAPPLGAAVCVFFGLVGCRSAAVDRGGVPTAGAGGTSDGTRSGGNAGVAGVTSGSDGSGGVPHEGGESGAGATSGGAVGAPNGGTAGTGGSSGAPNGGASDTAGTAGATMVIDHNAPGVIVVLGSSTAAGTGPEDPKNAWVERYRAYLKTNFPKFELTNLAVGGYTTYQMQPSNYQPPSGRPTPETAHNVTKALSLKPNAIIINMPTNDTNASYSAADQMANFDRVTSLAAQSGVLYWVTTSQPRNFTGDSSSVIQTKHALLMAVRDAIIDKYGVRHLNFWDGFAEMNGDIKAMYSAGDGTHMNDAAHAILVQKLIDAKIPEAIITKQAP